MSAPLTPMREYAHPDDALIRAEIFGSGTPAVLRGLVRDWPIVAASRRSSSAVVKYLRRLDSGAPVDAIMTRPQEQGRVFYNEDLSGFNFVRNRIPVSQVAEQVLRYAQFERSPAVAAQSALIRDCLPGFAAENRLTLLDESILPRIWLGNAITTPTHLDEWNNIGCVVAGRRRFTLFPPQQIANLYIGPLDFAPTGAPMSLVQLHAPDHARYPRFREALASAVTADLSAGDALYIPPLWWHHVESLERFNVLVNYWWHAAGGPTDAPSGFDSLMHAMLNVRSLPEDARAAWRALFEHYVFGPQRDVTAHIPRERQGLLGPLSTEDEARLRDYLARRLQI
ncbi:MAG TPA: cupin-like domain-containing protein [Steroidobacteraceae bacterium]|nr:cupin-like domain-containing protein [Steroidobacteraceae bacterium]